MIKELRRVFLIAVALAVGAPGLGAAFQRLWPVTLCLLVVGALWLGARQRRWLTGLGVALCIATLVVCASLGVGMVWLLIGMVGALAAWDLVAFDAQLAQVSRIENERRLLRAHLWRLGGVSMVGLLLGAAGLSIRVQLDFGLALIVAALTVLGAAFVLHHLGKQQEDESDHVTPPA